MKLGKMNPWTIILCAFSLSMAYGCSDANPTNPTRDADTGFSRDDDATSDAASAPDSDPADANDARADAAPAPDASPIDASPIDAARRDAGAAQITMAPPGDITLNEGATLEFHWSATADTCSFDGSALNGATLPNWKEAGYACVGEAACADPNQLDPTHTISYTFANAGIYKFQLTCSSGWNNGQPETQVSHVKTVRVQGSQPPDGSCTGPAGTTRQTTVTIADIGSWPIYPDIADVDTWADVWGLRWRPGGVGRHWPGVQGAGAKLSIKNNHFVSLRFTVPTGMPYTSELNDYKPRGSFGTAASDTTHMMTWALTITEECGDFDVAGAPPSRQACYDEFSFPTTVPGATWMVRSPNNPYPGACNLTPGHTYYLNIMPASLSNPSNGLCTEGICKVNLSNRGVFDNGAKCTPQTCD